MDRNGLAVDERRADRLCRRIAPRMIEAQRALQRHPPQRPLVLRVQRVVSDPVRLRVDPEALGEGRVPAAVERVGQVQVVAEVLDVLDEESADVAELEVVRARHDTTRTARHVFRGCPSRGPSSGRTMLVKCLACAPFRRRSRSVTPARPRVGLPGLFELVGPHAARYDPKPASRSNRLVVGDDQVNCLVLDAS